MSVSRKPIVLVAGEIAEIPAGDDFLANGIKAFASGGVNIGDTPDPGAGNLWVSGELQLSTGNARLRLQRADDNYIDFNNSYLLRFRSISPTDTGAAIRMILGAGLNIGGLTDPGAGKLSVDVGYSPDAGGLKHKRVSAGAIANNSTALVDVTWATAFADANYTPVCSLFLASGYGPPALQIAAITIKTAVKVQVAIINQTGGSLTPDLFVIAIHD